MTENTKSPTLVVVKDGDADESAQEAFPCPSPPTPTPNPPRPRRRRRVVSRRPPAKPRPQLSPEEEAERRAEVRRRRRERIAKIDINNLPEVLGVPEVACLLRVSTNAVYAAAAREEIPCARVGRTLRFSRVGVLEWLRAQDRGSPPSRRG